MFPPCDKMGVPFYVWGGKISMRLKRVLCLVTLLCLLATAVPALASAKYYITVDITNQIVTVYKNGNTSDSGIVRQMICSTGKSGTPTPTGTYSLPKKRYSSERREWYYFSKYKCYAKWATRITGGILFHSVLYSASKAGPTRSSVNALGSKASHGCVRLRVDDAKWIAQNCPAGTRCKIYKSGKTDASLRKRLLKKSFSVGSETYAHFLGGSDDSSDELNLSKGSKGSKVTQLQKRLIALGFLDDSADGKFGPKTQTGVKRFQAAAGKNQTGKVNDALWASIFADDAPTGTYVTLSKGMTGPAVQVLQKALSQLKLYSGSVNGSYNSATVRAVKDFQTYNGYSVTGKANSALQKDVIKQAADVVEKFGDGDYRLVTGEKAIDVAKLTKAANLYAKSKTSSTKLAKLKKGTEVEVLSKTGGWARVTYDRQTGYIQTKYLKFSQGSKTVAAYEKAEDAEEAPQEEEKPQEEQEEPAKEETEPTLPSPEELIAAL